MKHFITILALGLVSSFSALAQGVVFNIDFGANPPPHTPGDPFSGATLTGNDFYAILYLDDTEPLSASIQELDGGSLTTVLQFSTLVYASYSGGGPAFDYENSWDLTDAQTQSLLAGQWYAQVNYDGASYSGQIVAVPEPSSITLLAGCLMMVLALSRHWRRRPTGALARAHTANHRWL